MARILILCTGNSCRSQMAEAVLRALDPTLEVASAGTDPAPHVHPKALQVLAEIGIHHPNARPKNVNEFLNASFDYVITVCDQARESCPIFTGSVGTSLHMGFDDPASARGSDEDILSEFRRVRDDIKVAFTRWYETTLRKDGFS